MLDSGLAMPTTYIDMNGWPQVGDALLDIDVGHKVRKLHHELWHGPDFAQLLAIEEARSVDDERLVGSAIDRNHAQRAVLVAQLHSPRVLVSKVVPRHVVAGVGVVTQRHCDLMQNEHGQERQYQNLGDGQRTRWSLADQPLEWPWLRHSGSDVHVALVVDESEEARQSARPIRLEE